MAFLLQYNIGIIGQEQVKSAFRSIEAEALASNRRTLSRLQSSPQARPRTPRPIAADASTSRQTALAEVRAEKARRAEQERTERAKTAAANAQVRARIASETSMQRQRSAALYSQYRADQRAHEKAERDKTRSTEREEKKRTAIEERESRKRSRLAEQESKRQKRLNEAAEKRSMLERKQAITGVIGGTASRVASVGRAGVAMAGLGAGALFATATHGAMAKSAAAADLANQLLGNKADAGSLKAQKEEILAAVAGTRGFAAQDVIAGMSKFQGTAGEAPATLKMAPILTQTSLATGANMEDLGDMYASMYAAIRNSSGGAAKSVDQIISEVERLGRVFGAMGQVGAIEIKDVASVGSEITAAAMSYSGDITSNIQKVGAMMQIAKQTGGAGGMGGAEASTAAQNFANDLVQKKDDVEKYLAASGGKTMFADKSRTKLKSLDVLLPELMAATGGDLVKMGDVLNIRGTRALKGFTEPYQEAYQAAKKAGKSEKVAQEEGKKAVSKRFEQFAGIEMTKREVTAKAEFRLEEADKKLEEQMRKLSSAVGAQLLPVVTDLIPKIANLVPIMVDTASAFATFLKVISENPLSGLGTIIGVAFAAELAKAKIASLINTAITGVAKGGAPVAAPTAPGAIAAPAAGGVGVTGALAALTVGVAAFTITSATLNVLGSLVQEKDERATKSTTELWQEYHAKKSEILSSSMSESEKQTKLAELSKTTQTNLEYTKESTGILPGPIQSVVDKMPEWALPKLLFSSATGEALRGGTTDESGNQLTSGIAGFQKQLEQDQAVALAAAKELSAAAKSFNDAIPRMSINTSNTPTAPVK